MISFKNVRKKYGDIYAIKNINLELPRYGLVSIHGPSGCGKTTLLNCISSLLDYQGEILIDGNNISNYSEDKKDLYRLKNFGFIFQDFKLFETETVINNILFPLDTLSNARKSRKDRKCLDLLDVVGLSSLKNQPVNKLSGGEKQRAAIARALVNDPKIIFADEPTGSLDNKTSREIMAILEKVSKKALVILVSHDEEIVNEYSDIIIEMNDGEIISTHYQNKQVHEAYVPISKNTESNKKPSISSNFLISHTVNSIKHKKWRTLVCNLVTSLGLVGVGLSIILSSSISSNIKKAYSSIIDNSKVVVSVDESSSIYGKYAGSYYEAKSLQEEFPDYVLDVGTVYDVDFEYFFKDNNSFYINSSTYNTLLEGFNARHINEFKWLDYENINIYPETVSKTEDDEIVVGLTIDMIHDICLSLKIERTVGGLSDYLKENSLYLCFAFENTDWQYSDEQIVRLKGFTLEKEPCLYHSNHMWNEYMFETRMRFPSSDALSSQYIYPWTMKKIYYFHTFGNTDDFLESVKESSNSDYYIFDIGNATYFPNLYRNVDIENRHRVLFYFNTLSNIPIRHTRYFYDACNLINHPLYASSGGYSIYPASLMMGFSKMMYFSFSETQLEETLDANSSLNLEMNETSYLPKGVKSGHFTKTLQDGVSFQAFDGKLLKGREAVTLDEIVVSSKLLNELLGNYDYESQTLYLGYTESEIINSNGKVVRDFISKKLKVTGVVESNKLAIYHRPYWTIGYFQSRLGVSAFDLLINAIAFDVKSEKDISKAINQLKKAFPQYEVTNPLNDVYEGVDEVCSYIKIALLIFSIISLTISILLLSICNYLHVLENRKEIGLARCLGVNKKESKKFLFTHSVIMCSISFILSTFELLFVSIFTSVVISDSLHSEFSFSFDPICLVYTFIISLVISLLSTLIIADKTTKISPLESLKS